MCECRFGTYEYIVLYLPGEDDGVRGIQMQPIIIIATIMMIRWVRFLFVFTQFSVEWELEFLPCLFRFLEIMTVCENYDAKYAAADDDDQRGCDWWWWCWFQSLLPPSMVCMRLARTILSGLGMFSSVFHWSSSSFSPHLHLNLHQVWDMDPPGHFLHAVSVGIEQLHFCICRMPWALLHWW